MARKLLLVIISLTISVITLGSFSNVALAPQYENCFEAYDVPVFASSSPVSVGVEAGDWVTYSRTHTRPGESRVQWKIYVEFLSVDGTNVTLRMKIIELDSLHEQERNETIDVLAGTGISGVFHALVIPANWTIGNYVYLSGLGTLAQNVTIEGEITRVYANMQRTLVYANISTTGTQYIYYWDKQTGVLMETSIIWPWSIDTSNVVATNMWHTQSSVLNAIAIAAAISIVAAVAFYVIYKICVRIVIARKSWLAEQRRSLEINLGVFFRMLRVQPLSLLGTIIILSFVTIGLLAQYSRLRRTNIHI